MRSPDAHADKMRHRKSAAACAMQIKVMSESLPLLQSAQNISVALLVGLLIGLDRERSEKRDTLARFGGIRTFPLIALLGAIGSLLYPLMGVWPLVLCFVAVGSVIAIAYLRTSHRDVGATTEIAALVTFVLGVVAGQGALLVAASVGVAVAVLLVAKFRLEAFSHAISQDEINSTLELAVISAIILPLLPNQGYGPYQALNPFKLWMVAVLISAVSFAGFVAMRLWGVRKGLFVTAFVGALVSSTAVTMAMAARSRSDLEAHRATAAGAVMAATIMCVRVFVLAWIFGVGLAESLWPALAAMTLVGVVATVVLFLNAAPTNAATPENLQNPSRLPTAVAFALVFAVVGVLVPAAKDALGSTGLVLVAALSAVADVDAITIALAQDSRSNLTPALVLGVVVASVVNTWIKGGIAVVAGRGRFRWMVALPLAAMGVLGLVTAVLARAWVG